MRFFYYDRTVVRMNAANEWWTAEAFIDGSWREITPRESDLEHLHEITEEQADALNAQPPGDRVRPTA